MAGNSALLTLGKVHCQTPSPTKLPGGLTHEPVCSILGCASRASAPRAPVPSVKHYHPPPSPPPPPPTPETIHSLNSHSSSPYLDVSGSSVHGLSLVSHNQSQIRTINHRTLETPREPNPHQPKFSPFSYKRGYCSNFCSSRVNSNNSF